MAAKMSGDAWLYQELDELKKLATESPPDGGVALNAKIAEQAGAKAEVDGVALANPHLP